MQQYNSINSPLAEAIAATFKSSSIEVCRKRAAWEKTQPLSGLRAMFEPEDARLDHFGNVICWSHYGQHSSHYGWEIDHICPKALGGSDDFSNLRALKCSTNRGLGGLLSAFRRT